MKKWDDAEKNPMGAIFESIKGLMKEEHSLIKLELEVTPSQMEKIANILSEGQIP